MKKLMLIVAGLLLATAAPVAAGDREFCLATECKPPVLEVEADVLVCGDPRMWVRWENTGNVDTKVKWVFRDGNKKKGALLKRVENPLDAGQTRIKGPRWVLGGGATVKLKVYDPINEWWFRILEFKNYRDGRWGEGDCPADRFGTPTWNDPTHTTR
jgi:hypothetical protein